MCEPEAVVIHLDDDRTPAQDSMRMCNAGERLREFQQVKELLGEEQARRLYPHWEKK